MDFDAKPTQTNAESYSNASPNAHATSESLQDRSNSGARPPFSIDINDLCRPRPLSRWVMGTTTVTLCSGAKVKYKTSQAEAILAQKILTGQAKERDIDWTWRGWLSIVAEQIAAIKFTQRKNGGLRLTNAEQKAFAKRLEFHGGLYDWLTHLYKDEAEPWFSLTALLIILAAIKTDMAVDQVTNLAHSWNGVGDFWEAIQLIKRYGWPGKKLHFVDSETFVASATTDEL